MSRTIDERVVSMQFDNKQFENNVQTSISTLDKLKQKLNLTGASKGLENISAATKTMSFSPIASGIETIQAKFSALEVMAVTALANITNSAVNAGKRLVSAFTIEPIKTGLSEYETQINAVQTILANTQSKGTTLDDVNGALDELNTYADKTIYNFTEMTRNIGTFTAAGVDLDTSVAAIKGIANLAAVSGSNSQQASTAMYQLSQALSTGTVKLQDWNSVTNAGMGGQVFQDALKETARVHGIAIDDIIKDEGSFRESLSTGWLSSEILLETLNKFTGDLTEEQLKSMGYTNEQIKEIMKLGETANDAATKVKTFTQLMDTLKEAAQSGWTQTWEILIGDFEEAKALWTKVSDVFGGIINASAEARNTLLQGWADGGGRDMAIESFKNIFEAIKSIIVPIREAFREIFPPATAEQLLKITTAIRDFTAKLKLSDSQSAKLKATFKGLFSALSIVWTIIKAVAGGIVTLLGHMSFLVDAVLSVTAYIGDWISGLRDWLKNTESVEKGTKSLTDILAAAIDKIKEFYTVLKEKISLPGFEGFLSLMRGAWNIIKSIAAAFKKAFSAIGDAFSEAFRNGDIGTGLDLLNGGIFAAILLAIKKFVGGLSGSLDSVTGILDNVKGILDSVRGCFEAYQENLKAKTLMTIASAIAILAASILVISLIDSKKLAASLGAITVLFGELMGSLALFSRMSGGLKGTTKTVSAMLGISVAVLILAAALKTVSSIEPENMIMSLIGIATLSAIVVQSAKSLSKHVTRVTKGATGLIMFALAVKVLASACKSLSTLSWTELAKGLAGVGVLMSLISVFINNTKFSGKAVGTATGIVLISAAIKILASACSDFGSMKWEEIGKGLAAIGGLLAELAIFTNLTGNAKHVVSTGLSLVLIAASMKIFASALKDFVDMSWEEIGRGLFTMAEALIIVTAAVNFMPKNMVGIGLGLIAISTALLILASALGSMGGMSWEEIGRGLTALGGSMLILAVGLNAMTGTLGGSAALLIAAAALAILTPCIVILGSMSWETIGRGLLTLAGAFAIIGVAGLLLSPIIPAIMGLAVAMALIGVGAVAAGAGLLAISIGLTALAASGTAVGAAISAIIVGLLQGIGIGIVSLAGIILAGAPIIIGAISALLTGILTTIIAIAPLVAQAALALITALLDVLITAIPLMVDAGMKIILGILKGIRDHIGEIVTTAIEIIVNFIKAIASKIGDVIDAGFKLIIAFINGLADAIRGNTDTLLSAVGNLFDAVVEAIFKILTSSIKGVLNIGKKIMDSGLMKGIKDKIKGLKNLAKDAIEGFKNGLLDNLKSIGNAAKDIGSSLLNGVKNALGINSPSKEMFDLAVWADKGLIKGLESMTGKIVKTSGKVGNTALNAMRNSIAGISDMVDSDIDNQPTIRPVLDLSDVRAGAGAINGMFAMNPSVGVMANVGSISSMMNTRQVVTNADVVSAISDLKDGLGNTSGNSYTINGITYDDGSNVSNAIKTLINAARIERRV